jgi:hypothetical protein
MKKKSWFDSVIVATLSVVVLAGINGCDSCQNNSLDTGLKNAVVFQYDHVANVHEIRFPNKVEISGTFGLNSVSPVEGGFWAVFVLCSLDVQGKEIQTFNYDASKFFVEYEGQSYGPLQPFKVRYEASTSLNSPTDTPKVAAAIANELQLGPSTQPFPRGFYPSLNYRIAILIPQALQTYRGEQLTLTYTGQPSIVQGRGHSPTDVPVFGSGSGSVSGICRPLLK